MGPTNTANAEQRHSVAELEDLAFELRSKLLYLCGTYEGAVHIGGDLSVADILVALYHYGMDVDPTNIVNPKRDRFILSKGHAAVCMYIAMAMRGFFEFDDIVNTYGQLDSAFGMHPCKVQLPGVEASTGSLGHGLPIGVGMAKSARQRNESHRVFVLMGDGETGEFGTCGDGGEAGVDPPQGGVSISGCGRCGRQRRNAAGWAG